MKTKNSDLKNSILWTVGALGGAIGYIVIAQLTYALTESYAMSASYVGLIFLASRVFDGVTDFIAGTIIDHTNTRWGKARIYDLAQVFVWIAMVFVFSVPTNLSTVGKFVYVFIMYNMYTSVFSTLRECAEPIRMKRSLTEKGRVQAVSISSVVTSVVASVAYIAMPILISIFENQPHGWTVITLIYAIPGSVLSIIRFLALPEINDDEEETTKKEDNIKITTAVRMMITNKYVVIIAVMVLITNIISTVSSSASTYYFKYVYGNVAAASVPAMFSMVAIIAVALLPKLTQKFGTGRTVFYTLFIGVAGYLMRYIMPTNLAWYCIWSLVANMAIMPATYLAQLMLLDAMDFCQWKNGQTPEGIFSAAKSIAAKVGLGLVSVVLGLILDFGSVAEGGYTTRSIQFLNNGLPAVGWIICIVVLAFYDLDKKMPGIKADLAERNVANAN